jgi:hypothetical protein
MRRASVGIFSEDVVECLGLLPGFGSLHGYSHANEHDSMPGAHNTRRGL